MHHYHHHHHLSCLLFLLLLHFNDSQSIENIPSSLSSPPSAEFISFSTQRAARAAILAEKITNMLLLGGTSSSVANEREKIFELPATGEWAADNENLLIQIPKESTDASVVGLEIVSQDETTLYKLLSQLQEDLGNNGGKTKSVELNSNVSHWTTRSFYYCQLH